MRNAVLNFNAQTLVIMAKSLDAYHDLLGNSMKDFCYRMNTQPSETAQIIMESEEYKSLLKEVEELNKLKKQIAYQRRLCKV